MAGWLGVLFIHLGLGLHSTRGVTASPQSGEPRVRRRKRGGSLNVVVPKRGHGLGLEGSHAVALHCTSRGAGWLAGCISGPGSTRIRNTYIRYTMRTYVRTNRIRREPPPKIKEQTLFGVSGHPAASVDSLSVRVAGSIASWVHLAPALPRALANRAPARLRAFICTQDPLGRVRRAANAGDRSL